MWQKIKPQLIFQTTPSARMKASTWKRYWVQKVRFVSPIFAPVLPLFHPQPWADLVQANCHRTSRVHQLLATNGIRCPGPNANFRKADG